MFEIKYKQIKIRQKSEVCVLLLLQNVFLSAFFLFKNMVHLIFCNAKTIL